MKRPNSEMRQRDSRRILPDSLVRRRISSVPFPVERTNRQSMPIDSDTDFLCDRTVEFMDSGDIVNIVGVELAEHSVYFERLLRYHRGKGLIKLPEFLNGYFNTIIDYIRKRRTDISEANVYHLFIASDYLLVEKLKGECARFINNMTNNPSVAIQLWLNGRNFHWPELGDMAFEKILEHFDNAWKTNEFLELTGDDVKKILTDDSLNCKYERNIFEAIIRWVRHGSTRQKLIPELLSTIRIGLLTEVDVAEMKSSDFLQSNNAFITSLNKWPILSTRVSYSETVEKSCKPRTPHEVVLVFGGWTDGEGPRAAAQVYDPRADTWTLWTEFSSDTNLLGEIPRRVYAGCVLVEKRVYLIGGFDGTNALKSTLCYDFEIDSGWYEISCMYEKRYYVSVAYANKFIYALGGHNGENQGRLDTAERYNLEENLWHPIATMRRVRSDASAAELGGRIYICGGFEGRHYHDSTEYYDPDINQWTLINRMSSPRGGVSLVRHEDYIYAIGGNDGHRRLKSIERYDPKYGHWEIVGYMNRRKSNLSSAVINDDIYIIGGWSDEPESGILDLVEKYNIPSKQSVVVHPLNFPASATCSCTLKDKKLVNKYIKRTNQNVNSKPATNKMTNASNVELSQSNVPNNAAGTISNQVSTLTSHGESQESSSSTSTLAVTANENPTPTMNDNNSQTPQLNDNNQIIQQVNEINLAPRTNGDNHIVHVSDNNEAEEAIDNNVTAQTSDNDHIPQMNDSNDTTMMDVDNHATLTNANNHTTQTNADHQTPQRNDNNRTTKTKAKICKTKTNSKTQTTQTNDNNQVSQTDDNNQASHTNENNQASQTDDNNQASQLENNGSTSTSATHTGTQCRNRENDSKKELRSP